MSPNNNRPALEPPPGQQSDFDSPPESLQTTIIVTLAVCLVVSTVSVAMRAYAQLRLFKGFVWADGNAMIPLVSVFRLTHWLQHGSFLPGPLMWHLPPCCWLACPTALGVISGM